MKRQGRFIGGSPYPPRPSPPPYAGKSDNVISATVGRRGGGVGAALPFKVNAATDSRAGSGGRLVSAALRPWACIRPHPNLHPPPFLTAVLPRCRQPRRRLAPAAVDKENDQMGGSDGEMSESDEDAEGGGGGGRYVSVHVDIAAAAGGEWVPLGSILRAGHRPPHQFRVNSTVTAHALQPFAYHVLALVFTFFECLMPCLFCTHR